MNCPGCGTQTLANQQFCRSCGASLSATEKRPFNPQVWGLLVMMLMFTGLLISAIGKMIDLRWLSFAGLFIMIGGMFLVAAYALWRQTRPREHKMNPPAQPPPIERADTTNKLLPVGDDNFIHSVTDPTTELLKTPVPRRSISGELS